MAHPYDDRYRGERGRHGGFLERAGEEVRSWFGGGPGGERRPERGSTGEHWEGPPRWSGDYGEHRTTPDRTAYRGWNEPEHGSHSMSGYGGGTAPDGDWRWSERSPRDSGWAEAPPLQNDWSRARSARDDESRYGEWWSQRQRDWRYETPRSGAGRPMGEARGIYEDDYGRVHQFAHRPGMNFAGRGPKGYRRSDERIREDVCERLTEDWRIDASDVEVTVNNGEVTLAGAVQTREEKRAAEDLLEQISGVRDVHNNLRVSRWEGGEPNTVDASTAAQPAPSSPATGPGTPRR